MSPLRRNTIAEEGTGYVLPFVGPVDHTVAIQVDVSSLTTDEVDADGYIKPGTPIQLPSAAAAPVPGALVTAADQRAGVVVEATKVAEDNTVLATAPDVDVALATMGQVNRAVVEDTLGRVLTANELAALRAGNIEVLE